MLFLLNVNDIPSIVDCTIKMFADDTKIYWKVPGQRDNLKAVASVAGEKAVAPPRAGRDRPPQPETDEQPRYRSTEAVEAEVGGSAVAPPGAGRDHPPQPESTQSQLTDEQQHSSTEALAAEVG